jgi:hydroxymethylpyrimidine/phosphomethylpyrimidine kinase
MNKPCVLVFAGLDPSGGAGIQADIEAIAAMGAHALPVITTLTVQDNDRVHAIHPADAGILREQVNVLTNKIAVSAVKIGITGSRANVAVIGETIKALRATQPALPVVLDTVLASGHGDALSREDAVQMIQPLLPLATVLTPNLPEAERLCDGERDLQRQAEMLQSWAPHVLIKGGHAAGDEVINDWFHDGQRRSFRWPRLPGEFHGTGCTLASAIAAGLALGQPVAEAVQRAQAYVHQTLQRAYPIAQGQTIPARAVASFQERP